MYMGMGVSGGEEGARNGALCCTACSAGQPMLFTRACWEAMMTWLLPLQLSSSDPQWNTSACAALSGLFRAASHRLCLSMLQAPP